MPTRPSHPTSNARDDREAPLLVAAGCANINHEFPKNGSELFCNRPLKRPIALNALANFAFRCRLIPSPSWGHRRIAASMPALPQECPCLSEITRIGSRPVPLRMIKILATTVHKRPLPRKERRLIPGGYDSFPRQRVPAADGGVDLRQGRATLPRPPLRSGPWPMNFRGGFELLVRSFVTTAKPDPSSIYALKCLP